MSCDSRQRARALRSVYACRGNWTKEWYRVSSRSRPSIGCVARRVGPKSNRRGPQGRRMYPRCPVVFATRRPAGVLAAERRQEQEPNLTSCWVGIIDDDASVRAALERVLRCHGISVETFASAEEYLSRSVVGDAQCVVLDVQLGALSGFHLQDHLVSRGASPPIIFITAQDDIPTALLAPPRRRVRLPAQAVRAGRSRGTR